MSNPRTNSVSTKREKRMAAWRAAKLVHRNKHGRGGWKAHKKHIKRVRRYARGIPEFK